MWVLGLRSRGHGVNKTQDVKESEQTLAQKRPSMPTAKRDGEETAEEVESSHKSL